MKETSIHSRTPGSREGVWVRASRCTPNNNCVELRLDRDGVAVRDSKGGQAVNLVFGRSQWTDFLARLVR